eukprot:917996-Amorphochlora_amoeboformis.AAC.1
MEHNAPIRTLQASIQGHERRNQTEQSMPNPNPPRSPYTPQIYPHKLDTPNTENLEERKT